MKRVKTIWHYKFLIAGIFNVLLMNLHSQEIVKYSKRISDTTDVVLIGKLDASQKESIHTHYLLLKRKKLILDTLWRTQPGPFENDYIQISDLVFKKDSCTFLLSNTFGIQLIINSRAKDVPGWEVRYTTYLAMSKDLSKLKRISLLDNRTTRCEYASMPVAVYRVDNKTLRKYLESAVNGKTVLREVEIE